MCVGWLCVAATTLPPLRGPPPLARGGKGVCANNAVTCYKSRMAGEHCSPLRGCAKFYLFCVIPSEPIKASRGISTEQRTRGRGVNTPNNYLPNVTLRATPFPQTMRLRAFSWLPLWRELPRERVRESAAWGDISPSTASKSRSPSLLRGRQGSLREQRGYVL